MRKTQTRDVLLTSRLLQLSCLIFDPLFFSFHAWRGYPFSTPTLYIHAMKKATHPLLVHFPVDTYNAARAKLGAQPLAPLLRAWLRAFVEGSIPSPLPIHPTAPPQDPIAAFKEGEIVGVADDGILLTWDASSGRRVRSGLTLAQFPRALSRGEHARLRPVRDPALTLPPKPGPDRAPEGFP